MGKSISKILPLVCFLLLFSQSVLASGLGSNYSCGVTDYTGGSGRLYDMSTFVLKVAYYVLSIVNAVAAILSIISATQIYIKMNMGEDGITKNIMMVVGSLLFLIGSSLVLPSFFGVQYGSSAGAGSIMNFFK